MRYFCSILCLFGLLNSLAAQSPAANHAWLNTDNISVRITPTGIHADSTGGFLLNGAGGQPVNLLSHLAPWIGGIDPAGNLMLACEMDDPAQSDWKAGYQGIQNSSKVWKVTRAQINAHRADFQDNGVIDNPIAAVFSWPAQGNAFSIAYNGFEIPPAWASLTAYFYDQNENGLYNPDNGDYPLITIRGQGLLLLPEQMAFSIFHNDTIGGLTKGRSVKTNASLQAFTFDCNSNDVMENAVFLAYKFKYEGQERQDSSFIGLYSNFDIGDPHDDYLGCEPLYSKLIYTIIQIHYLMQLLGNSLQWQV